MSQLSVPVNDAAESRDATSPRSRPLWSDALHVFVLSSFAVAQPVYERLGQRLPFLIDQSITAVWCLVFVLSVGLPGTAALCEVLLNRYRRNARDVLHSLIVFVLLVLSSLLLCIHLEMVHGAVVLGLSLALAGGVTWWYFESRRVRAVVTLAAPGVLLFPIMFLMNYVSSQAVIGPSASRSAQWQPVPVVVLVFDEFCGATLMTPEREIDAERFPNFAALAKQSTWFRSATSVNPNTEYAVPAILSGRLPVMIYPPWPKDLPQNLFNVLHSVGGYEIAAFEPVTNLSPLSLSREIREPPTFWNQSMFLADILSRVYLFQIAPADYRSQLPPIPPIWFGWRDSDQVDRAAHRGVFRYGWSNHRVEQFQHFLRCFDESSDSTLLFGHFLLPHVPWCYLPSGNHYLPDNASWNLCIGPDGESSSEFAAAQNQQRYLLQVMFVDRLIGQLLSRLTETGLLDRCLLVVTADHGTSFRAGQNRRWLGEDNMDEILSVPLFIKLPHQSVGQVSDRAVESVDILPTIADVVGITLEGQADGWSVLDTSRAERPQLRSSTFLKTTLVDPVVIRTSRAPGR